MPESQATSASITLKMLKGGDPKADKPFLAQAPGYRSLDHMFPDDRDPEIRGYYVMRVEPAKLDAAIAWLLGSGRVQYANKPPERRLQKK